MGGEKAGEDRVLANGAKHIDFQTDPSRYRHWKLDVAGDVATLTMDVDEILNWRTRCSGCVSSIPK
jgi:benzoyl-CoA-dihydrodiol lyase